MTSGGCSCSFVREIALLCPTHATIFKEEVRTAPETVEVVTGLTKREIVGETDVR